ncbi:hypothetical protein BKA64DRAFT_338414 [Cadophora sp. MPI-SDFR-AT-0126]|nr:hypothetical protein BKA64DRAFT_338414 [Leotiomycetes sp. MPI-SDFR-AT-0126]
MEPFITLLVGSEAPEKPKQKGKWKAKATETPEFDDEDAVDPRFLAAMLALEAVIKFFITEATKYQDDKHRLEYTFRNLHVIMYQARVGFAAELLEQDGESRPVRDARDFLKELFDQTAPDDPKYIAPTPPGLPAGTQPAPPQHMLSLLDDDEEDEANEGYPAVDVANFVGHMDEMHIHRTALAASDPNDDYTAFFERVANAIVPFHEEMHFNSKHTDEEWANLEFERFRAVRKLHPEFKRHGLRRDYDSDAVVDSRLWLATLFDSIDPDSWAGPAFSISSDGSDDDNFAHGETDGGDSNDHDPRHGYPNDVDLNEDGYNDYGSQSLRPNCPPDCRDLLSG